MINLAMYLFETLITSDIEIVCFVYIGCQICLSLLFYQCVVVYNFKRYTKFYIFMYLYHNNFKVFYVNYFKLYVLCKRSFICGMSKIADSVDMTLC